MKKTTTYTYFSIRGDFDPDVISEMIGIIPEKKWSVGDERKNGSKYDFSNWRMQKCDKDTLCIDEQCKEIIRKLQGKIGILTEIRERYNITMVLEIVPSIYHSVSPSISFDKEIIEFCYLTGTEIDIDMYIY